MKLAVIRAFFVSIVFTSIQSWGQVVIISDVDDTIKVSRVLDTFETIENAFGVETFWQMPELYRSLAEQGADFFFVSNAPVEVMAIPHTRFLEVNSFPEGPLFLPMIDERADHKIRSIQNIINERNPKTVVLLGDNGERDIKIYDQAVKMYKGSGIRFLTFIRIDYHPSQTEAGMPLGDQKTFVTAGEVALSLLTENLISPEDTRVLLQSSIRRPGLDWWWSEKRYPGSSIGLPHWVNCKSHKVDLRNYYAFSPLVRTLEDKIQKRCSIVID